ncbi:MAG: ketoacyl-ACP synthase III [Bacteroidetes bacterium]|nr:ketoacyl-ACP synthase III [Bacteroidota bacterium]
MFNTIHHVALKGLSVCVPSKVERTMDYNWISEEERAMFIRNTGVEEKRTAGKGMATSDLCERSANALIEKLGWERNSIDVLIFVSQSPDYFLPATSAILQNKLQLKKDLVAFDVNLGCSGYIYGLQIISNLLAAGNFKRGLLLAGDKSTLSTNYRDKSTYPLFGDAGTATALEFNESAPPMYFNLFTDGSGYKSIIVEDGGSRNHVSQDSFVEVKIDEGIYRCRINLVLDGMEIFNFALREVAPSIENILKESGVAKETIDYFVFHQANRLINESVRKKCRVEPEKVPYSIDKFGNTSSASVPLTMLYKLKQNLESRSLKLLLSGFGVGYSWGNCIVQTDNLVCTDILEI